MEIADQPRTSSRLLITPTEAERTQSMQVLIVVATVLIYLTQWQVRAGDIALRINNNKNNHPTDKTLDPPFAVQSMGV